VAAFAMMTPPPGWLQCNGAAVSRVSFAHLFSAIGTAYGSGDGTTTFNVPDLRGEFVRGWDAGRGVDAGRTLGSKQGARTGSAGLEDFTEIRSAYAYGTVEFNVFAPKPGHPNYGGTTAYRSGLTPSAIGETRPRNVALMYCIKT
ncbi:phage tail protein, partial [Cutibacterium acnes]